MSVDLGTLEEYRALRAEILKRLEIRYQLLTFTMVASGTFATVAVKGIVSATSFAWR